VVLLHGLLREVLIPPFDWCYHPFMALPTPPKHRQKIDRWKDKHQRKLLKEENEKREAARALDEQMEMERQERERWRGLLRSGIDRLRT
jgi:hypothetical protein